VLDVLERARVEVVDADDAVTVGEETVAEVRAEEAGAAGDEDAGAEMAHGQEPFWLLTRASLARRG
jgi:hypothetical protein